MAMYRELGANGDLFPRLQPPASSSQSFGVGPIAGPVGQVVGPTVTVQQAGWRFVSADDAWTVSILHDSFAIETARYTTWDGPGQFAERLTAVVHAAAAYLRPAAEARLGLRYVNQIVHPRVSDPQEWRGFISDEFLGPVTSPELGPGVQALESRVSLDLGNGANCMLRYGSFGDISRPGFLTYLVDTDCYRESQVPFEADGILRAANQLNTCALGLFQKVAMPELRTLIASEGQAS